MPKGKYTRIKDISPAQEKCFRYIVEYWIQWTKYPYTAEIAAALGIADNGVCGILRRLHNIGYLGYAKHKKYISYYVPAIKAMIHDPCGFMPEDLNVDRIIQSAHILSKSLQPLIDTPLKGR